MGRRALVTATLVLVLSGWGAPGVAVATLDEYQVKAAFLYNFLRFVQWPPGEGPLIVAVLGDDPFDWRLDQVMKGRSANGRDIVVKRIRPSDDVTPYHLVFISGSEARRVEGIVDRARGAPVLTVGDTDRFVVDGGMVRLFVEGQSVRFQIDIATLGQAGLKASAQLLSLAVR